MPNSKIAVLVVEDEALIRFAAIDLVEGAGYEAIEAKNADEAILLLEARSDIRVVFTDIDMPGSMDGLKLAAAVRDRFPPVQIIVTSGHRSVELSEMPAGSVFFSKPYQHAAVMASMRQMLAAPPG